MIARNYIKHPAALLAQLELRLDEAAQYFQDLTPTLRDIWARLLAARKPQPRRPLPKWAADAAIRARALAAQVRKACQSLLHEVPLFD